MGHEMGLRLEALNELQQMEQESVSVIFEIVCVRAERRDEK
jgi:hypothetical protein